MLKIILSIISLGMIQCGVELDYRIDREQGLDGSAAQADTTDFFLTLPDRKDFSDEIPVIDSELNYFLIELLPSGELCEQTEAITSKGAFEDSKEFQFALSRSCSYEVKVIFGSRNPSFALQSVSYEGQLKTIIDAHCVSCHENYASYQGMEADFANIVLQVENQTMPPAEEPALSSFQIANFSAWKSGGYINEDPNKIEEGDAVAEFSKIFYRNNHNEFVFDFQLKNNTFVIYDASVWLQSDGSDAGWPVIEMPMPKPDRQQN